MEKRILSIPSVDITVDSLLSALRINYENDLFEDVVALHKKAVEIAKPVALYAPVSPDSKDNEIWLGGIRFEEPFVYKMLSTCDTVIPYVASCGREIDDWSQSFTDAFEQFVVDTIKQLCLRAIMVKMFSEVTDKYFDPKKNISALNPGSLKEWPMTGQLPLFDFLGGVTEDIGVSLSGSLLMSPTKSTSGIMFQSDETYENCQLCPRIDCPNRRAPYVGD